MDNQNEVQDGSKSSKVNNCNKTCLKTVFSLFGVFVIALCSTAYISNKNQQINIDTSIPAFNSSLNEYKECNSKESCKKEDEKKLLNTLVDIENIYSRDFYSAGKLLEKAEKDKFNSFTKDTINFLIDMKKHERALSLIMFSSEYFTPQEIKQALKEIYENREKIPAYLNFDLAMVLERSGFYFESTKLFMSNPDFLTKISSEHILKTLLSFGCKDDFLIWGGYYAKTNMEWFFKKPRYPLITNEYLNLTRAMSDYEVKKINTASSEMIFSKKYPSLSSDCDLNSFSLYK